MTSILIVDDEPVIRKGLSTKLNQSGEFKVVGCAEDGVEALKMIDQLQPDIVITDINMPNMDGLEMLERIHEADDEIAIIVLTGYDRFSYAQRALRAGAADYLLKPISASVLNETISKVDAKIRQRKSEKKRTDMLEKMLFPQPEAGKEDVEARMMAIIQEKWNDPNLNMDMIAEKLFMNSNYLRQVFKAKNQISFVKFLREMRLHHAARLLTETNMQVQQISDAVGYQDSAYFSICFRDAYGASPREYRENSRNFERDR